MEEDEDILGFFGFQMSLPECRSDVEVFKAEAELKEDISPVFPYINARVRAEYNPEFPFVRFRWKDHTVTLHPKRILVSNLADSQEAAEVLKEIRLFINETWRMRGEIKPSHEVRRRLSAPEIFKRLPQTNCGACGYSTCLAFAAAVSRGEVEIERCSPLFEQEGYEQARRDLKRLLG